ncbi:head decoration protein [Bacillus subtilis]|uniref:head decoration protein n=1 Tax=Pseudochrobactrum asaccharolyticum TaxID=354351 RepID=UPI001F21D87F|nr:head decoration protein [Pseudochrobactrum asaccharolyticum]MCF7646887.1 head decoration protein [Pseudochrobactrum asaccharolyticum]MCF7673529.1 head decoration protein [Bacillus subtilis]
MNSATMGPRNLSFVLHEGNGTISYEIVTIAAGSGRVSPGTVLGAITSNSKYVPSPAEVVTGQEGAETASAILAYGANAIDADVEAVVLVRTAEVKQPMLLFHDTVNTPELQAQKIAQLAKAHIIAR